MRVPFIDLQRVNMRFEREFGEAHARVMRSGRYLRGPETQAFEREYAAWNGSAHCVCVANGLDALRLVMQAWITLQRLSPGDEVVVPANTFIASALAVTEAGLSIRLADVDPATHNVTAATVEAALTPRTRAVMPVHLYGQLADVEAIRVLCAARGLLMLEDAAQAHGAALGAARAGTFGHAGTFSFYPAKNLGALGDAGCVVTDDANLADCVRMLGNYGSASKYEHVLRGLNSRIDELQAAILRIKHAVLDRDNQRRRTVAARFCAEIVHPLVRTPAMPGHPASHVWHLYVVTTPRRHELEEHLRSLGVETMIHYPKAVHAQTAYRELLAGSSAPVAERLQHEVLSLPISPVMTDDEIGYVIAAVNRWPAAGESRS
jgi:dTDP-4-amino-4,6-dideoxygalactose transaminase